MSLETRVKESLRHWGAGTAEDQAETKAAAESEPPVAPLVASALAPPPAPVVENDDGAGQPPLQAPPIAALSAPAPSAPQFSPVWRRFASSSSAAGFVQHVVRQTGLPLSVQKAADDSGYDVMVEHADADALARAVRLVTAATGAKTDGARR